MRRAGQPYPELSAIMGLFYIVHHAPKIVVLGHVECG